jgi:hypothetical protein
MKNIVVAFIALCMASVSAQENYTMKMSVRTEGLPPEYAAYGEQEIVTYMKGDRSRTDLSSMMMNSTVYYDGKLLTSLNDMMGEKSGFTATKEELEAADKDKPATTPKIEYFDEKRTIAGYECKKAIITSEGKDKKEKKVTVWYTDKIKSDNGHRRAASRGMADFGDLKGHPLAMEMTQMAQGNEMKIVMTTTEVVTTPIDDSVFKPATDGYQMMTYKEWQDKMKARQMGK